MVKEMLVKLEKKNKDTLTDIDINRVPNYFKDKVIITGNYQGYIEDMKVKGTNKYYSRLNFKVCIARRDTNIMANSWSSHKHDSRPIDKEKLLSEETLTFCIKSDSTIEELCESVIDIIETSGLEQEKVNEKLNNYFSV